MCEAALSAIFAIVRLRSGGALEMQKRKRSARRGNILSMHGKLQEFSIESHLEFMTQRAKTQLSFLDPEEGFIITGF